MLFRSFPEDGAAGAAGPNGSVEARPSAYSEWAPVGAARHGDGEYNLEAFVSAEITLAGHLAQQVSLAFPDAVDRMIAQYLVDLVDEAGYIAGDLADAAAKLGAPPARVDRVLCQLQTFEPLGVCARNLTECQIGRAHV